MNPAPYVPSRYFCFDPRAAGTKKLYADTTDELNKVVSLLLKPDEWVRVYEVTEDAVIKHDETTIEQIREEIGGPFIRPPRKTA